MKKLLNQIKVVINNNKQIIIFTIILFLIGVISGSLFTILVSNNDKNYIINQVAAYFNTIKESRGLELSSLNTDLTSNIFQIIVIYVLGLSMIGVLAVILIMFFKGFVAGVTLSGIMLKYKLKGIIAVILYFFPIYFFKILLYIFVSLFSFLASLKFIKSIIKKKELNFRTFLGRYVLSLLISIILMTILCILDIYITPTLIIIFQFL